MFTPGRIAFIIFFVIAFAVMMIFSYRKDAKRHEAYYKNAAKKVTIWGLIVIVVFVALRYLTNLI